MTFLDWTLYGNTVRNLGLALGAAAATFFLLLFARSLLQKQLQRISERTHNLWDDIIMHVVKVTRTWMILIVALWVGLQFVVIPDSLREMFQVIVVLAVLLQLGIWGSSAIRSYSRFYSERNVDQDPSSVMTVRAVAFIASVVLWVVLFLVFLENLGIDVTALVAGLGIGGIAVALAAQNILGDLFASLSIVLDKPFVVGDFIIVGDLLGTVEKVGLKTTRVRALSGEQLVFSNTDLLNSRIRNFKRMFERRIVFAFGVEYGTPREQLEWIPGAVKEVVEALPDTRFDRAHFKGYGDSSLDFEVVYYVLKPDYNVYMDLQQSINLELYRLFEERDISFAFPTRTLHIVPPEPGNSNPAAATT